MPDDERPSASCEQLRKQLNEALQEVDDEETLDMKVKILRSFVFGHGLAVLEHLNRIYRRLPRRPWIANAVGGISLLTIVGLAWAAGARLAKMDARDDAICVEVEDVGARADKATAQVGRVERRMARIDGNLDALMRSRGLRPLPPIPDSLDSLP